MGHVKRMLEELAVFSTRDDAGRHFTVWSVYWPELEEAGYIEIERPVDRSTGIPYDSECWGAQVTFDGIDALVGHGFIDA